MNHWLFHHQPVDSRHDHTASGFRSHAECRMNRERTNQIRFMIEELIPPILRDSFLFRLAAKAVWGGHIDRLAEFRKNAPFLTPLQYETLYREHPRVHEGTDNSAACTAKIIENVLGESVCDVGCGTGDLLRKIRKRHGDKIRNYVGTDFVIPDFFKEEGFRFVEAPIEKLPFDDASFDTVICTHVIEHILDFRAAIAELRRITRKRLIIVVPREREGIFTFNPHFNFFPYTHSFLRAMIPVPADYICMDIQRDIYYHETSA
jgi:SAM-dependent methyltransferase